MPSPLMMKTSNVRRSERNQVDYLLFSSDVYLGPIDRLGIQLGGETLGASLVKTKLFWV